MIVVEPGQRIQLSLIDFSSATRYRVDSPPIATKTGSSSARYPEVAYDSDAVGQAAAVSAADYCYVYATVAEDNKPSTAVRRFTICAEESRNEQIVYTSVANALTIEVTDAVIADMSINFIIKYTGRHLGLIILAKADSGFLVLILTFKMKVISPAGPDAYSDNCCNDSCCSYN